MDQVQQPVVNQISTPYSSPMQNYGGSIIALTNPDQELYKMELTFRGIILDSEGKPKKVGEALLNDAGITSIVGQVQSLVSQVTIMGDLKDREIPMLIDLLADTLAKDLMVNRLLYNITNPSARDRIYSIALITAFVCMKRAWEGGDRKFWKGSQQDIRTEVVGQGNKGGVFQKFNPFKM